MKKMIWWGLGAALILAAGGGWMVASKSQHSVAVQMATVAHEDLQAKVSANGKVQAQKKVDISATIMGQVTHIAVKEGDAVKKGQFLLQIDQVNSLANTRSSEAGVQALLRDLEAARANRDQAQLDFERAQKNWREKIIAEADYQRAKTALDTAQANVQSAERRVDQSRAGLEAAKDMLGKTTVRAPMDGIVTAKRIEEGEVAVIGIQNSPGTVLLTISDMSTVESEMEVDETSIPAVKLGQEARVRIDAYPNRTFTGVVTEVGNSPITATTSGQTAIKFKVKIQIKDPPADIKPGLSVQADILTGFRSNAVAVPIQALVVRDVERKPGEKVTGPAKEEEGVYVVESGKVRFQAIKTGLMGELSVEVSDGLKGGEEIVSGPFKVLRTLKPGDAVTKEKKKDDDKAQTKA